MVLNRGSCVFPVLYKYCSFFRTYQCHCFFYPILEPYPFAITSSTASTPGGARWGGVVAEDGADDLDMCGPYRALQEKAGWTVLWVWRVGLDGEWVVQSASAMDLQSFQWWVVSSVGFKGRVSKDARSRGVACRWCGYRTWGDSFKQCQLLKLGTWQPWYQIYRYGPAVWTRGIEIVFVNDK